MGNYIYLVECFSRCLLSIHILSGATKIEAYLPWKFTKYKIGMLSLNNSICIYSPNIDHFLIYDCLTHQIITVKLEEIEADEAGFYYSNILLFQDEFIVLPFKGKEIRRYGINGKLKFKDSQWYYFVYKEYGYNKKNLRNIRMDSACIAGNQIFFSLVYGNQNYLCKYELSQDKHSCNIVYYSKDIAIRGVYAYSNTILFRKLFQNKTEIVLINLNSKKREKIIINYPSIFEEDIYGDINHLRGSFKNKILAIERNSSKEYQKIYRFKQSDVYVENGIIFNMLKNEILILDVDYSKKYSIEEIVNEIKYCSSYQDAFKRLFGREPILEGRYKLYNLIKYFSEFSSMMIDDESFKQSMGEIIWKTI